MAGKRILVTGAAGFMGSHLVDALVKEGHEVYGVDDLSGGYMRNVNPKSTFFKLDLRDRDKTRKAIEQARPEILFHLAADATEGRSQFTPLMCTERNLMAYMNTLVPCIRCGVEKVVLTSSMSVYGSQKPPFHEALERKPVDVYGTNKAAMEHATEILADVHCFKHVIIRPHNVYGPRQNLADPYRNVIGIFINSLLRNKRFYIYGDGNQKRAFSYIDDFTPYMVKAGFDSRVDGKTFNIGPVEEVSVNQLAEAVLETFFDGEPVPPELEPQHIPPRPKEVPEAYCTVDEARKWLGYRTTVGLRDGLKRMIGWARALGPQQPVYLDDLELKTGGVPQTWLKRMI